jgi:hypothetical protein
MNVDKENYKKDNFINEKNQNKNTIIYYLNKKKRRRHIYKLNEISKKGIKVENIDISLDSELVNKLFKIKDSCKEKMNIINQ